MQLMSNYPNSTIITNQYLVASGLKATVYVSQASVGWGSVEGGLPILDCLMSCGSAPINEVFFQLVELVEV